MTFWGTRAHARSLSVIKSEYKACKKIYYNTETHYLWSRARSTLLLLRVYIYLYIERVQKIYLLHVLSRTQDICIAGRICIGPICNRAHNKTRGEREQVEAFCHKSSLARARPYNSYTRTSIRGFHLSVSPLCALFYHPLLLTLYLLSFIYFYSFIVFCFAS